MVATGSLPELIRRHGGQSRISYKQCEDGEIQYLHCEEPANEISNLLKNNFKLFDLTVLPPRLEDVLSNLLQEKQLHA